MKNALYGAYVVQLGPEKMALLRVFSSGGLDWIFHIIVP